MDDAYGIAPSSPQDGAVPADDRLELIATEIEKLQTTALLHIAERLNEARDIFRYRRDEGGFAGWVESRLRWSRQTAYNLLHVHEQFAGQCVKNLDSFPASVLYLVAAPTTPKSAREEVLKRAEAGEPLSITETKQIVAKHKAGKVPPAADVEDAPLAKPAKLNPTTAEKVATNLHCSFCGLSQHKVRTLVTSGAVCICNECVAWWVKTINTAEEAEASANERKVAYAAEKSAAEFDSADEIAELARASLALLAHPTSPNLITVRSKLCRIARLADPFIKSRPNLRPGKAMLHTDAVGKAPRLATPLVGNDPGPIPECLQRGPAAKH